MACKSLSCALAFAGVVALDFTPPGVETRTLPLDNFVFLTGIDYLPCRLRKLGIVVRVFI